MKKKLIKLDDNEINNVMNEITDGFELKDEDEELSVIKNIGMTPDKLGLRIDPIDPTIWPDTFILSKEDTANVEISSAQKTNKSNSMYKYHEDKYINELLNYVKSTYSEHYSGEIQALDVIFDSGHATGFNIGNVQKYSKRYGKKNGYNRKDLMKILHYTILQLYIHDKEGLGKL